MTYLTRLNTIPPPVCRLIAVERYGGKHQKAKRPYRMLTMREIASKGGLPWQRAAAIARRKSFAKVTVEDAEKFRRGCGITMKNEPHILRFVKRIFENKELLAELFDRPPDGRTRSARKVLERL